MPIIGIIGAGFSPGKIGLPSPGRQGKQSANSGTGVMRDNSKRVKATTRKRKTKAAEKPLTQSKGYRLFGGR